MKKPAAPSPPPGTTPPTTDGKAAAKEAPPPLSPEEAFAYGAFPQPPSFKDMLGSGGMYAEAGTFDQYVKRGKRLLTVFGSLPTLREGQPSVGAWRLQRREVWEDNKYWHKWGTLGDLHRFPLMDLPYDTHLREADDYLTAFSIKADIFRLNQYSPIKAVGARHWTRLNAPDHWKADALLDRIISGPLRFVQAKWWTAFPSFSLLGSRRSITMRLAFQAPNGEVLEEVPFNAVLQGWGPQAELSYRIQRGVLLPHPKAEDAPELQKIPRAINHEGGFDFTFLWLHFGWLRLRAFPSRYMFYWGVNLPLPSLGVQSIEPGQLVRDAEEMAFGWDRHVALRTYEDMLMHEAFPITAFTVGTSGTAPIRKFLADEEELLLKSWLQRYRDKQKAEADKAARLTEQAKGDSAILAEQVKREAERMDQEARVREEEARFAAAIQKVLPDLTADPEIAKKVDAKEKEAAAALLNPRAWAPFDRTDAKLLQTLAVERKFKEYYLNRLAERFDLWLDTEDNWALDEDVQEFLSFNRASWRGGSGPLDIERLEDDEGDDQEDIRRGVASNTLGFEFPPETMGSRGWMEWYKEENELQDFYTQWWINVLWDCREAWQKRREQYAVARRTPAWLSAKGVEQQKADYKEQEEADKQAFTESFDADELRDDVEDLEEEDELEAYEERLQKLEREDAGEPEREGEANEEEGSDPRSKVLRTRRRPKPPPKREEGGEF